MDERYPMWIRVPVAILCFVFIFGMAFIGFAMIARVNAQVEAKE